MLTVLIKFLKLGKLMGFLTDKTIKDYQVSSERIDKIILYVDMILSSNFWIYKKVCLRRALTLYYFLRKQNFEVQVYYGLKKTTQDKIDAHAWIVHNGVAFAENNVAGLKDFSVTYIYPS